MTFVNPLDALGIDASSRPDPAVLRKARRRFLVEIQLSDGAVRVDNRVVERSDLIRAVDDLDDGENIRLYHALQQFPELNDFLQTGDLAYFRKDATHVVSPDEALIRLISPHFGRKYGQALAKAVRDQDVEVIHALAARAPLVTPADRILADSPVDAVLTEVRNDLDGLRSQVKAELLDPDEALLQSRLRVSSNALNALPLRFSTPRSQIARMIRNLGVVAYNVHDAVKPAFVLLTDAARIETSVDVAEDIAKQLESVREARDRILLLERFSAEMAKCTAMLTALYSLTEDVESGNVKYVAVIARVRAIVDPEVLNSLPGELNEVVVQVAFALRGLSVTLWNECNDAAAAREVLAAASAIELPVEAGRKLREDELTLAQLATEREKRIESDKADARKLLSLFQSMGQAIAQHRGDQVRWPIVSQQLCELLSPEIVQWLKTMKVHAPTQVTQVLLALTPHLAGLANFYPNGYDAVIRQLRPLITNDPALASLVSRTSVRTRAYQDPKVRRATSGPEVWEQGWFWIVVILGILFLLGLFA